jgi:parallel beta-helix repeat protein
MFIMYRKPLFLMLLMALSLPLAMMGQTTPIVVDDDHPFFDNFEGDTCSWTLLNGSFTNAWYWGTAAHNGNNHSIYISQDGGVSNTYNMGATTWVYATKIFTLESGYYRFSYDWKCVGENYADDYIRVGLLPSTTNPTPGSGLPGGWVSLDDGSCLYGSSDWRVKSVIINVSTTGDYKMVFAWRNDGSSGSNPPGAIDNVGISKYVMNQYTNITQTNTDDFLKGTGSNVNIADACVSVQNKMASVVDWAATTNLPQTLKSHQVVTWHNYVYCVGGYNGSNPVSNVYRATQQTNGISSWTELNALPVALRDMAVVVTQTQLIVIGGRNNETVSNKIYAAPFNEDGSIGAWEELSINLPQPCWGLRAVDALGNLYIVGGANTDTENDASDKVFRLTVNAMGEVNDITEMTNLPEARNGHTVSVYDSKIIVIGGYDATFTQKNTVYSIAVNLDGSLGTWTTQTALPNAVYGHTTICTNGILTVIGGMEGTMASNKFYYTDADASAYDWQLSDILLPERYTEGVSFAFGEKIFFCGGKNISGNLNNAVRYMAVTTSNSSVNHPVFISWPFNIGTPKLMQEINYTLTNSSSYAYEILYRTAEEDLIFSDWISVGTNLPVSLNMTKSFIQYMFRVTATGEGAFSIEDVTLVLSGYNQLVGNLNGITELSAENSPYLVTETIGFTSGTHNIEEGVTILFMPNTGMYIGQASVNFNGTEANPILLSALEDGNGTWNGVYFQDASDNGVSSVMNYTTIEKAGKGDNQANLRLYYTNQPTINHSTFKQAVGYGVRLQNSNPTITHSSFSENTSTGLYLDNSAPTCTSCTMSDNNYAGIYFATTNFNATFTGATCSNNLYGMYSCSPNRSFNYDESAIAFADNSSDIAVAGGTISSNQTWNYYANGYALLGNVNVYQSGGAPKLTIVPGNTIKVQTGCYIYVGHYYDYGDYGGMLYAVGTANAPITFTSLNGEVGGWNGLSFRNGSDYNSSSSLRYCVIENATTNLYCTSTNQPSIMWCTLQNATNNNVGLYNQANISIESCTLKNAPRGIVVNENSNPTMVSVVFENHSDACVRHNTSNCTVTYSNCTMKDSQYGIRYYTPDMNIPDIANVTFENNVCNIAVPGGTIYNTRTWATNSYAILDNINIYGNNGLISLTLSPASELAFEEGKRLSVDYRASLIAEGTMEQPITFTSLNGEVGGWNGLIFYDGSDSYTEQQSSLKHCILEKGNSYNLRMENTGQPALIENCTFRNSASKGVDMYNSYNTFRNCTFEDNVGYPLYYNNAHYVGVLEDLTFTNNQFDGVGVDGGSVTVNRTWNAYTYYILNTLYLRGNGSRFTLMPGSVLKFSEGKQLYIDSGEIFVEGTVEQPITFTSVNGEPGGWEGIYFGDYSDYYSQNSVLKHCIVENGNSYNLQLYYTYQPYLIENCLFQNSNGNGLYLNSYSTPIISKTTIRNNASYGIYLTGSYLNPIIGCSPENANSIYNNGGYAVYNNSGYNLNMTHNFWGNISSEYIDDEMIYDKLDNSSKGRITFEPVSWFPVDNFEHLQGTLTYDNDDLMVNSELNIISENDSIMATATTNGDGVYDFSNYAVGVYNTLDDDLGVDILAGVNATDALLVMRHFVQLDTLTSNYAAAADVNGSNSINGTDAMLIMRRAIDGQFPSGDFYFFSPNGISVSGDTCTYDLSFLCYGDVNGSYNPPTRDNSIELMTEGQLMADSYQEVEVPVSIKQAIEMGALTLYFGYPEEYLEIEDVVLAATGESLVFSATEGKLTVVWFSLNPVVLAENDVLINIKVHTKDLSNLNEPVSFTLEAYSELADGSAHVIEDVVIAMPIIVTETLGVSDNTTDGVRLSIYPNPASDVCTMTYELAEAGRVTVSIYNMMGVKVMDVANFRQESGQHEMCLSTESLAAGMYSCRITFEGENSWLKTTKLIIEK